MRKLFIFDMDGTLFDTEPISAQIWKEVAKECGGERLATCSA